MWKALLALVGGAIKAWNFERGKADAQEKVQLGLTIARAKDDRAAAKAAARVAVLMTEDMSDDDLDDTARQLAGAAAARRRLRKPGP